MSPSSFKLLLVGDGGVGKTQFINKITTGTFSCVYVATIGVEKVAFDNCVVWDTAGQEKFGKEYLSHYEGATHAIIMHDDRKITEKHVIDYLEDIRRICGDIPVLCLQNKNDITQHIKQFAISTRHMRREELMSIVNSNFGITLLT